MHNATRRWYAETWRYLLGVFIFLEGLALHVGLTCVQCMVYGVLVWCVKRLSEREDPSRGTVTSHS